MTTATWNNPNGGNWDDPSNWDGATGPDGTPDYDQDIVIPAFFGQCGRTDFGTQGDGVLFLRAHLPPYRRSLGIRIRGGEQ